MNTVIDTIGSMNTADLLLLKQYIESKIEDNYDDPGNFYLHDRIDDYIYIVDYEDGTYHYYCKGADAFKEYMGVSYATRIRRKTKDLFPVYETLKEKHERSEEEIRHQLHEGTMSANKAAAEQKHRCGHHKVSKQQRQQEWIS